MPFFRAALRAFAMLVCAKAARAGNCRSRVTFFQAVPAAGAVCRSLASCSQRAGADRFELNSSDHVHHVDVSQVLKAQNRVLALLGSLCVLTYADRICIAVAAPRLQTELHLDAQDWGYVTGAFSIAYMLFEIPGGYLADRFGARSMVARIVLWWSAFTALTGAVSSFAALLLVRFLFGVGEAGAYPTASTSIFQWFSLERRGRAFGIIFLCTQLGSALTPFLIVPLQMHFGWRLSFYVFGGVGVLWTAVWWTAYRNRPVQMPGISRAELDEIGTIGAATTHEFPWKALLTSRDVWAVSASACGYFFAYYFFIFWLPLYMINARGFTESESRLSSAPFLLAAVTTLSGGLARDYGLRRFGRTRGPRYVCQAGLTLAACAAFAATFVAERHLALTLLGICFASITFQQPTVLATCVDIGGRYGGAAVGVMNTAAAFGGLMSSLLFGYIVKQTGSYDWVLYSMGAALAAAALLWNWVDAARSLPEAAAEADLRTPRQLIFRHALR